MNSTAPMRRKQTPLPDCFLWAPRFPTLCFSMSSNVSVVVLVVVLVLVTEIVVEACVCVCATGGVPGNAYKLAGLPMTGSAVVVDIGRRALVWWRWTLLSVKCSSCSHRNPSCRINDSDDSDDTIHIKYGH